MLKVKVLRGYDESQLEELINKWLLDTSKDRASGNITLNSQWSFWGDAGWSYASVFYDLRQQPKSEGTQM